MSKICENTDGCAEQYKCDSALYLMSVIYECYSIIIDQCISAPGNFKEVVYGLNAVDKGYKYQLMSDFKLTVSNRFDPQMQIHTSNQNNDISLAKEFQHHMKKEHRKNVLLIKANTIKYSVEEA